MPSLDSCTSLIYWLGDESHELKKTKDFLERRIEDVMEFEKVKGKFRNSKFGQEFMRGPGKAVPKPEVAKDDRSVCFFNLHTRVRGPGQKASANCKAKLFKFTYSSTKAKSEK